jgi:Golgi apparatus protein 1
LAQFSCLRNVLEDLNLKLEPSCEKLMRLRLELYREAVEVVPLRDVRDLYDHLNNSPHRTSLLLVLAGIVGAIFAVGIVCGRVSKQIARREMKMR